MDYWTRSTKASLRVVLPGGRKGKSHETVGDAGAYNTPESNKQTLSTRRSYHTCCDVINDAGGTCIDGVHTPIVTSNSNSMCLCKCLLQAARAN